MILGTLFEALLQAGCAAGHHLQLRAARTVSRRAAARPVPAGHRAAGITAGRARARRRHRLPAARPQARAHLPLVAATPAQAREQMAALFVQLAGEHGEHQAELRIAERAAGGLEAQQRRGVVRLRDALRRRAQPERLCGDRRGVSYRVCFRRPALRPGARQRRAPLHRAGGRVLRPGREAGGLGGCAARGAVCAASGCASNSSAPPAA